jgi:hypothetical protein
MEKKITMSIGGADRTMDFGKFWFRKYYGQVTGKDPILNKSEIVINNESQFDLCVAIVYAGLKAHCQAIKETPDFDYDKVQDWVGCMEEEVVLSIITEYGKIKNAGEAKPHQNGAATLENVVGTN